MILAIPWISAIQAKPPGKAPVTAQVRILIQGISIVEDFSCPSYNCILLNRTILKQFVIAETIRMS